MKKVHALFLVSVMVGVLSACQTPPVPNPDKAAKTVETYLQAKVNRDADTVRRLLCSDLEAQYDTEVTAFEGTSNVRIEGMACVRAGESDVVKCSGKILADYGTETNEFLLGAYRIKQEDSEWKWCGEAGVE